MSCLRMEADTACMFSLVNPHRYGDRYSVTWFRRGELGCWHEYFEQTGSELTLNNYRRLARMEGGCLVQVLGT